MKRYANGEPVTKERMESEDWYPNFQSLMEIPVPDKPTTVSEIMGAFEKEYLKIFETEYPDKEQLLRWSVLVSERHNNFIEIVRSRLGES